MHQSNDHDIDAPEAWDITTGSSSTKIGIIDLGVLDTHEDLSGKVSGDAGWTDGHGFHVAGIAAANTNNNKGIAGIDWNAQIISQRIDGTDEAGKYNAIMDAVNAGADIINNSWHMETSGGNPFFSTTVRLAFANAYKLNVVAVASMGNAGSPVTNYPVGYGQGIIAVGATDAGDNHWSLSNTGNHIDVAAPGVGIWSAIPNSPYYEPWNGTSMAAPHVSGIAGLLLAVNSNLYNDDIEQIIRISAEDVNSDTDPGWDQELGAGRVNARAALEMISSPNEIKQWTANSGSSYSNTGTIQVSWYGVDGLGSGAFNVKRHEVRKTVTFPETFTATPYAWGRGVASNGFSAANPNYGLPYCSVVDGSVTTTSAVLRTFVYEVWDLLGAYKGWYPTTVSNATFAYTVLGSPVPPPTVSISGPRSLMPKTWGTFTANVTGGTGTITYQWYKQETGGWMTAGTASTQTHYMHVFKDVTMKVVVTRNGLTDEDTHFVQNKDGGGRPPLPKDLANLPIEFGLSQNYPNPFNPVTDISFALPKQSNVALRIYDVTGAEVKDWELRNSFGYQSVHWDATSNSGGPVAAGIYFYRLVARPTDGSAPFVQTRKMLLLK